MMGKNMLCLKYWFVSICKSLRRRTIMSICDLMIHLKKKKSLMTEFCVVYIQSFIKIDCKYLMSQDLQYSDTYVVNIHHTSTGICMALRLWPLLSRNIKEHPIAALQDLNISGRFSTVHTVNVYNSSPDRNNRQAKHH